MADIIKLGDFVEINYTGKTSEGLVFDTTRESDAKGAAINPGVALKPIIVCLGQAHVLPSLEKALDGKEVGQTYDIPLDAADAFGKKDAKLIQLISTARFKKDGVNPFPGMQVKVDDKMAVIRRISGGRTLVDFNHPLAGKDVSYNIEVIKKISDTKVKLDSYVALTFGNIKTEFDETSKVATLFVEQEIPEELVKIFNDQFKKVITEISEIKIKVNKKPVAKDKSGKDL